mgnify:CR=1 FL=1
MRDADIIDSLRTKLAVPTGRHLYGVLGSYRALRSFTQNLQQASDVDGQPFPAPLSVTRGILESIPDPEFKQLASDEAKRPEPVAKHVSRAFELFLRESLHQRRLLVLSDLELLFAYNVELNPLRTLATDEHRLLLLLPGKRERGGIVMFPELGHGRYGLPSNLIAEDHLWQLDG